MIAVCKTALCMYVTTPIQRPKKQFPIANHFEMSDELRVVLDDDDVRRLLESDAPIANGDSSQHAAGTTDNAMDEDVETVDGEADANKKNDGDDDDSSDDKPLVSKRLKTSNNNATNSAHSDSDDDHNENEDGDRDEEPVLQQTTFFDLKRPQQLKRAIYRELSDLEQFASDEATALQVRNGKPVPVSDARLQALMRQKYVRPAAYVLASSELKTQYEMDELDETFLAELNATSRKSGKKAPKFVTFFFH